MNKKSAIHLVTFGLTGLIVFLGISLGITSCINQESKGLVPDYPYTSLTPSSNVETSSQFSSSDDEELPIPEEEQIDHKEHDFTFTKKIESEMIQDLFERMFDNVYNHETPDELGYCVDDNENDFGYDTSYQILHKTSSFKCPYCNKTNKYLVTMTKTGLMEYYVFKACTHLPNGDAYLYINFATTFANYLNKEDSVLVGANYKYDFGLIKKGDIYYFQFLGLNIPVITNRLDRYYYEMLDSMDVRVEFNVIGNPDFDLDKKENFVTKNLIPLMFYKHFANICIDYQLTSKAQELVTNATNDLSNSIDSSLVPEDKQSDLEAYKNELKYSNKYKIDFIESKKIVDECFVKTLTLINPNFKNNDNYFIDENNNIKIYNEYYCEAEFGVIDSGSIIGEYKYKADNKKYIQLEEIFPFFNNFSLTPGWCYPYTEPPVGYVNGEAVVNYANKIGTIATLGCYYSSSSFADMVHGMSEDVYNDFQSFSYSIGLTDAYYQELEFYIEKGLFTHCALSYVNALLGGEL